MAQSITPQIAQQALTILFGETSSYAMDVSAVAVLSQQELAARFRSRALEVHPDRAGPLAQPADVLERAFKRLHGAYRVLSRIVGDETLRGQIVQAASRRGGAVAPSGGSRVWTPTPQAPEGPREAHESNQSAPFGSGRYYQGAVPRSELRLAQFLYYHRVIDWKTMIDAVTWQYRVRPKVGEIGRAYRFLDFESVTTVLRSSPRGELFGDTALKLGLLDRRQLYVVLGKQHQLNYPIGRYFLEKGILTRDEIEHLVYQNRRHNLKHRLR